MARARVQRACCKEGCSKRARWQVGFDVWADREKYGEHGPISAWLDLWVCQRCKRELKIEDLIGDMAWAQIVSAVEQQGRASPDRSTIQLKFRRL